MLRTLLNLIIDELSLTSLLHQFVYDFSPSLSTLIHLIHLRSAHNGNRFHLKVMKMVFNEFLKAHSSLDTDIFSTPNLFIALVFVKIPIYLLSMKFWLQKNARNIDFKRS